MALNTRKQRTIKNSIVNIDNVIVNRGFRFKNWIIIARQKLWERECKLLRQRLEKCDTLMISKIQMFTAEHAGIFDSYNQDAYQTETTAIHCYQKQLQSQITNVNSPLIVGYLKSIQSTLMSWDGYHPTKTVIATFRDYFQHCRQWFDGTKIDLMARTLWIPFMNLIGQVSRNSASQTFHHHASRLQTAYGEYLQSWLLRGLFEAQIQPNNCKLTWIVPASAYEIFHVQSHPIVPPSNADASETEDIRTTYLNTIEEQIKSLKHVFNSELSNFYGRKNDIDSVPFGAISNHQAINANSDLSHHHTSPSPCPKMYLLFFCQSSTDMMALASGNIPPNVDVYAFQNN
eukprot:84247_1